MGEEGNHPTRNELEEAERDNPVQVEGDNSHRDLLEDNEEEGEHKDQKDHQYTDP